MRQSAAEATIAGLFGVLENQELSTSQASTTSSESRNVLGDYCERDSGSEAEAARRATSAEEAARTQEARVAAWQLRRRASDEALSMFRLVGKGGETVRTIREQIYIAPQICRALFAFIERRPAEASWVLRAMEFRNYVLREFDSLARSAEHAEQIAQAEAEAVRRAAAEIPALPLLHELGVTANA